jgi:hypothetical protein
VYVELSFLILVFDNKSETDRSRLASDKTGEDVDLLQNAVHNTTVDLLQNAVHNTTNSLLCMAC